MVEPLQDMPPGTMDFRIAGTITREEYHEPIGPVPGKARVVEPDELEAAKAWLAEGA